MMSSEGNTTFSNTENVRPSPTPAESASDREHPSIDRVVGSRTFGSADSTERRPAQPPQTQTSPALILSSQDSSTQALYVPSRQAFISSSCDGEESSSEFSDRDRVYETNPDDTQEDYLEDDEFDMWLASHNVLQSASSNPLKSKPRVKRQQKCDTSIRNKPISLPSQILSTYNHNGIILHPQNTVELEDGDFMKIREIVQDVSEVTLRGWKLQRVKFANGLLAKKINEVCWMLHLDNDDSRSQEIQCMETVDISEVVKRRRIRFTNLPFPAMSFREHSKEQEAVVYNERVLVCRWKYMCYYPNSKARRDGSWCERAAVRLRSSECDNSATEDGHLRENWRGITILGGSSLGWIPGEKEFRRQENISNQGRKSRHSLQALEHNFLIGDPMERGCVGTLITEDDLTEAESSDDENQTTLSTPLATPRKSKKSHFCTPRSIRDLSADMEGASLGPTPNIASYPEVTEIDAEIKQTVPAGTLKRKYSGTITSTFSPLKEDGGSNTEIAPSTKRSRLYDQVRRFSTPAKNESDSDSDRTLGHDPSSDPEMKPSRSNTWLHSKQPKKLAFIDFTDPNTQESYKARDNCCSSARSNRRKLPWITFNTPTKLSQRRAQRMTELTEHQPISYSITTPPNKGPVVVYEISPDVAPRMAPQLKSEPVTVPTVRSTAKQRYTFADCFCGAGGMSRAAVMAGLRVEWGFDFGRPACESYGRNFYGTTIYNLWADAFIQLPDDHRVGIMHISPPCQFFSPAHTHVGKDDEMNTASLFAMGALIEKAKPRIVTLEQTAGLPRRHEQYFNAVINMLTSHGYSARWRIIKCPDYGLAQRRPRLVIIASW